MAEEKKPKQEKERFEVAEIATQTTPVIRDTKKDEVYTELTILCKIANDLEKLKKQLL